MKPLTSMPLQQRGATLVVALIFLVILAMLGMSAAQNNALEERMSGNTRNRDIAFQAADATLKKAQDDLPVYRVLTFDGTSGLLCTGTACLNHANDANYWKVQTNWTDGNSRAGASIDGVASDPKYVVEKILDDGSKEYYRVTARGVGGDSSAVVILQAVYCYTVSSTCP